MSWALTAYVELREDPDSPIDDYYRQDFLHPLKEEEWEQFREYILNERDWGPGALRMKFNICGESERCRAYSWIPADKTAATEFMNELWEKGKKLARRGPPIEYYP